MDIKEMESERYRIIVRLVTMPWSRAVTLSELTGIVFEFESRYCKRHRERALVWSSGVVRQRLRSNHG